MPLLIGGFVGWCANKLVSRRRERDLGDVLRAHQLTPYEEGENDGLKGRANRYADKGFLSETAWKAASKAERAREIRDGSSAADHGFRLDPYGKRKMIKLQLAAPGTPDEYRRGYLAGDAVRKSEARED